MSVILNSSDGFVLCHEKFLVDIFGAVKKGDEVLSLKPHGHLFEVLCPYAKDAEAERKVKVGGDDREDPFSKKRSKFHRKRKHSLCITHNITVEKVDLIENASRVLLDEAKKNGLFNYVVSDQDVLDNNRNARNLSQKLYKESEGWINAPFNGGNNSDEAIINALGSEKFIFPERSRFFCRDVFEMKNYLDELGVFDLIVIDPPWWNKYIRRKKAKCSSEGYKMISNENLLKLPLKELLSSHGMIAVWCTNADCHLDELRDLIFPAWDVKQIANWTWLKVTRSGDPICFFSTPPGKQPFEQLILGIPLNYSGPNRIPEDGKIFMSIPSAIHSHKPPLSDLLRPYLPSNPRCLEIFARYLLPHWTSWGLEVTKLMHESLFEDLQGNSEINAS